MAKHPGRTRRPKRLAVIPSLEEQFQSAEPLCNGAQTGRACRHYWLTVKATHDERGVTGVLRERFCTFLRPQVDKLSGAGGEDMLRFCSNYLPGPALNKQVEMAGHKNAQRGAVVDRVANERFIAESIETFQQQAIQKGMATGKPQMFVAGVGISESRFQGKPEPHIISLDGEDKRWLVQFDHVADDGTWSGVHTVTCSTCHEVGKLDDGTTCRPCQGVGSLCLYAAAGPSRADVIDQITEQIRADRAKENHG